MIIIQNAKLISRGIIRDCDLAVDEQHIKTIGKPGTLVAAYREEHPDSDDQLHVIDAEGLYLSHGFIDCHVHGGGGHDYMDGTEEAWFGAGRLHLEYGTTGIVPTTLSSDGDELLHALAVYEGLKNKPHNGAKILGIHVEGPYLAPSQSGAQDPAHLRTPDPVEYHKILAATPDILRWTVAPELEGALEMGAELEKHGIVGCIGHSDATIDEVRDAVLHGFKQTTHLYSAMSTITRRDGFRFPGVVESAYLLDALTSEIIADGCHLPPDLLEMAYRFIGPDRLCLVTDAMRAAGKTEGESILGSLENGQRVILEDGVAKMPDRTAFAGSIATADRLVRTMHRETSATLADCIKMITETPARAMGLQDQTGTVAVGRLADLILFDEDINIQMTMLDGDIKYNSDEFAEKLK